MTAPADPAKPPPSLWQRAVLLVRSRTRHHSVTMWALAVRGSSVISAFAVTFVLGARFGPAATGQYAIVNQTAIFLAAIGLIGLETSVIRHFSKALAQRLPITPQSLAKVLAVTFGLLTMIVLVLWLGGSWVWASLFGTAVPPEFLWVMCAMLVGRAGGNLLAGLLRSQGQTIMSQAVATLVVPGATAVALVSGLAGDVSSALWAGALAGLISIVIGIMMMFRHVSTGADVVDVPLLPVLKTALPLWGVGLSININQWYILYVAAQLFSAADIGLIRVAVQIASMLQIIATTIFSVYSAPISAAFHSENPAAAARFARSAIRVSLAVAVPLTFIIVLGGEFLLSIIGPEFVAALPLLWIMTIGNLAFVVMGPAGLVLAMSGKERVNLSITIVGTVLLVICLPIAGRVGGLIGMTTCMVVLSILRYLAANLAVRHMLKLRIWAGTMAPDAVRQD